MCNVIGRTAALFLLANMSPVMGQELAPVGRWQLTGEMLERREYAGGVRLNDGRILAVSGHPLEGKSIASAELYNPRTGTWNPTGSLTVARNGGNGATLLLDGRVVLVGGHNNSEVVAGAEIFDPARGQWRDAGRLSIGRDPAATLLADGRVLLSGGIDWYIGSGKVYAQSELFDPASETWTVVGSLATTRHEHRTVALDDGRALAVGGYDGAGQLLESAELFDPAAGVWRPTGGLPAPRAYFSLLKLPDGSVLLAGGYTGKSNNRRYLDGVLAYDPKSERWNGLAAMKQKRGGFSITLLPDGMILVAGGVAERGLELKSAELFDPRRNVWSPAAALNVARRNHRAALLPDGSVLVIGGSSVFGAQYLASCEIYDRP